MTKKNIFWGVLFTTFMLLFSNGFALANPELVFEKKHYPTNESLIRSEEPEINTRSIMKNMFFGRSDSKDLQLNFFTSTIKTVCDDVEKTSEITFGMMNEIDVDNDPNTGVNGKDIQVQYLVLPIILPSPELTIGAMFSVSVERIGNEIKDDAFSLSAMLADNLVSVGYESPEDASNEIPKRIQLSSMIFIEPLSGTTGFTIAMDPSYESGEQRKQISLFAGFDDSNVKRTYTFGFQPASETQITLRSTKDPDKWTYTFTKDTPFDTVFTAEMSKISNGVTKETKLTIDSLPNEISFSLALTPFSSEGGSIEYESDSMYDVSVLVETSDIGRCKYALIKNTPRALSAEWIPSRENGFYHIDLNSDGTSIYLFNSLSNPTINLSINELSTVDMTAFWNLTNPGDFEIFKDPSLQVDLNLLFEDWEAELDAEPTAEHIYFSWKSNISGYMTLDTDQLPLSNIDLLVRGPQNGLSVTGETLSADDFHLEWTVWPLSEFYVHKSGTVDFLSLSVDVYVNDGWIHLWPLF
jgi:hypothetical protein